MKGHVRRINAEYFITDIPPKAPKRPKSTSDVPVGPFVLVDEEDEDSEGLPRPTNARFIFVGEEIYTDFLVDTSALNKP